MKRGDEVAVAMGVTKLPNVLEILVYLGNV